jgi:adenine-specific DNA-methyltransferase
MPPAGALARRHPPGTLPDQQTSGGTVTIKYIGSKRTLVPRIADIVTALPDVSRVCDLFTGTTRVAQALKARGLFVVANDIATYSYELAIASIEADAGRLDLDRLRGWISDLNALPGYHGYYTKTFCEDARYFQPANGRRIDAIRDAIDELPADRYERAILLVSLMLAADRVDSTTGLQMAYLKQWAPRAYHPLELRLPELLPGTGSAVRQDAIAFVEGGGTRDVDLTYVDPPYNQHSYFGNYHVWESLMRHDRPATYGVANKRVDTNENRSVFNSSRRFHDAFKRLLDGIESPYILVSFNNEGYISQADLLKLLEPRGYVQDVAVDFKRYVGAQIGIFNPSGEKVGKVSHLRNKEHLFLVGDEAGVKAALAPHADEPEQLQLAVG